MSLCPKKEKRLLKELVAIAYERDLNHVLSDLQEKFKQWNKGEIDQWTLNQEIHEYHNNTARELYKMYAEAHSGSAIMYALRRGVISLEEVPASYRDQVEMYEFQSKSEDE